MTRRLLSTIMAIVMFFTTIPVSSLMVLAEEIPSIRDTSLDGNDSTSPSNPTTDAADAMLGAVLDSIEGMKVPAFPQKISGDCGVASMSMVEMYKKYKGRGEDWQWEHYDAVYESIVQLNNRTKEIKTALSIGYKDIKKSNDSETLSEIYKALEDENPVIIYRGKNWNESEKQYEDVHWSVVFGYNGDKDDLEKSGFRVWNTRRGAESANEQTLSVWLNGYTWLHAYAYDTGVIDNITESVSTLTLENWYYPVNKKAGEGFASTGLLISSGKITSVDYGVKDTLGNVKFHYHSAPNTKYYGLMNGDDDMKFSGLSSGTYIYYVSAVDDIGGTLNEEKEFTVSASGTTFEKNTFIGKSPIAFSETLATEIKSYNANLIAKFTKELIPEEYGVYFGTDSTLEESPKIKLSSLSNINSIQIDLNKVYGRLNESTGYYYKFFVVIDGTEYTSEIKSFTTLREADNPAEPVIDKQYKLGDIVNFGHRYYGTKYMVPDDVQSELKGTPSGFQKSQNGRVYWSNGKDTVWNTIPVRWIVLDDEGDDLVLMSEYVFEGRSYSSDTSAGTVTWASSELRSYINSNTFMKKFFSAEEMEDLLVVPVDAETIFTEDKLTIPSNEELLIYFDSSSDRKAHYYNESDNTPDVTTPISGFGDALAYDRTNYTCAYWTRTSNRSNYGWSQPMYVDCNGDMRNGGRVYYTWSSGIRPIIRLKKSSVNYSRAVVNPNYAFEEDTLPKMMEEGNISAYPIIRGVNGLKPEQEGLFTTYTLGKSTVNSLWKGEEKYLNPGKWILTANINGISSDGTKLIAEIISIPQKEKISAAYESNNKINLSWTRDNRNSIGYQIERAESKDGTYEVLYSGYDGGWKSDSPVKLYMASGNKGYVYSYNDESIENGKTYWYRIRGLYSGNVTKIDEYESPYSDIVKIEAIAAINEYTLTYNVNGGNPLEGAISKKLSEGTAYGELPIPTRDGYVFEGWYTAASGGEKVTSKTICNGDTTIYAHWTKNGGQNPDDPINPDPDPENQEGIKIRLADTTETYTYTGTAIKPDIIVTNNGKKLLSGTDYTVKYTNNINANDDLMSAKAPTITVTGKGNLTGSASLRFAIEPKNLEDEDVAAADIVTMNEDKASPQVYYNGMLLKYGRDYDYGWTWDDIEESTGEGLVFLISGEGNYCGDIRQCVIQKDKTDLKKFTAKTVIADKNAIVYDGSKKTVSVEVYDSKDKTKLLAEHQDYVLVYGNNVNAGTATVTVIGTGSYTGTKKLKFTIKPSDTARVDDSGLAKAYAFNAGAVTVDDDIKVTDEQGNMLTQGVDYKVTYSANKKVGTAKYKVTFLGNYKATKAVTKPFTITQGKLSDANTDIEIAVGDVAYTGKAGAYKSNVYVTLNGTALKKSDYTVAYYKDEAYTKEIKTKADYISLVDGEDETTVYVKVTGKGNFAPTGTGNGSTDAGSTGTDTYATASYKVVRNDSAVNLNKVKITVLDEKGDKLKKAEYTGQAVTPQIKVEYKDSATKTMKTLSADQYKIQYQNNVNKGKATIVLTGNGIDTVGSKTATFIIASKNLSTVK